MTKADESQELVSPKQRPTYQVRLPGFIGHEEFGLGDVIKRVTSYTGIKPCGGCERRAAALNGLVAFTSNSTFAVK